MANPAPGDAPGEDSAGSPGTDPGSPRELGAWFAEVPVDAIVPNPRQPRQVFDEDAMAELDPDLLEDPRFKANAAWVSGSVLLVLGVGVLVEVGRRVMYGAEPVSGWMIGTALVSLAVNLKVLRMLAPLKSGEVHLRATWLFTRADVVANVGVILAGLLVWWLASPYPDFVIGALIGLYVIKEAFEILGDARRARADARKTPA